MNATPPHRERGVALLTAMIIVALVATLASAMVWQQWRAIEVEAAERGRAQSSWILSGALDWARLILREDARAKGNAVKTDNLGEPWAVPLAEARLSTFLAADKDNNTDSGPEAFLSGSITDAQGRYNLNNLVGIGDEATAQIQVLTRLCELVGVSGDVAGRIAKGLNDAAPVPATPPSGVPVAPRSGNPLLMPQNERQLTWLGIEPAALERLLPYVVLLPTQQTKVNVNTASREVIAAATGLDLAGAERLVQMRASAPFKSVADIKDRGALSGTITAEAIAPFVDVASSYFEVRGRLRLEDRTLEEISLVQRTNNGPQPAINAISRERSSTQQSMANTSIRP